jgi:hypothetical protein
LRPHEQLLGVDRLAELAADELGEQGVVPIRWRPPRAVCACFALRSGGRPVLTRRGRTAPSRLVRKSVGRPAGPGATAEAYPNPAAAAPQPIRRSPMTGVTTAPNR